jgi:predicted tellurium resistance membrane protein TerC
MNFVDILFSLLALSFIEIVLGIDNLVFISLNTARLPKEQQKLIRRIGLTLALVMRLLLLFIIVWLASLTKPLFSIAALSFSLRDLLMIGGGGFLVFKSITEYLGHEADIENSKKPKASWKRVLTEIIIFDLLFSLDSIITAVGIVQNYWVMATAIIIAVSVMLFASEVTSRLIFKYPRLRILAVGILFLVGLKLLLDGFSLHLSSNYIFCAMGFALFIEALNILLEKREKKHHGHH